MKYVAMLCNKYTRIYFHNIIKHDVLHFSWQPESKFPFAQVRLPPKEGPKPEFQETQEIEVFSRSTEHEACGWWKAVIKVSCSTIPFLAISIIF